jgi:hypothetical protein
MWTETWDFPILRLKFSGAWQELSGKGSVTVPGCRRHDILFPNKHVSDGIHSR